MPPHCRPFAPALLLWASALAACGATNDESISSEAADSGGNAVVTDAGAGGGSVADVGTDQSPRPADATREADGTGPLDAAATDSTTIEQADFYVSPTGSDANAGPIDQPFATIGRAEQAASAGQLIYVRGGHYALSVVVTLNKSGTSGHPIRLFAYPGERPVLDAAALTGGYTNAFTFDGASYWNVRGLEIASSPNDGVFLGHGSTHNVLEALEIHDSGRESQYEGMGLLIMDGSTDNLIVDSVAHHNWDKLGYGANGGGNADGFGAKAPTAVRNVFRRCIAHHNSDDGFDFWNAGPNTIEDCIAYKNGYADDGTLLGDGNGFKLGGTNVGAVTGGHRVTRCVAYDNKQTGFDYNGADAAITLYNNTAYDNASDAFSMDTAAHVLVNNIAVPSRTNLGAQVVATTNSWDLGITDPKFASTDPSSSAFLRLSDTSPAIDRGTDVALPFSGTKPDLGAYEHP